MARDKKKKRTAVVRPVIPTLDPPKDLWCLGRLTVWAYDAEPQVSHQFYDTLESLDASVKYSAYAHMSAREVVAMKAWRLEPSGDYRFSGHTWVEYPVTDPHSVSLVGERPVWIESLPRDPGREEPTVEPFTAGAYSCEYSGER